MQAIRDSARADWVLNVNYTDHSIVRFRSQIWGDGRKADSGLMVGYWQSLDFGDLVADVNGPRADQGFPASNTTQLPSVDGTRACPLLVKRRQTWARLDWSLSADCVAKAVLHR